MFRAKYKFTNSVYKINVCVCSTKLKREAPKVVHTNKIVEPLFMWYYYWYSKKKVLPAQIAWLWLLQWKLRDFRSQ